MFGKSTTFVATGLMTSLLATALAAPSAAAQAGRAQLAEVAPHSFTIGNLCQFRGNRQTHQSIRRNANASGYLEVRNIRFVPRRYGADRWCGFYRADAVLWGRPIVIFADSRTGRIVGRQELARYDQGRHRGLSVVQLRTILLNVGYRDIRDVRHVRRGGRDVYMARAIWRGWVVRLSIDDQTGRVVDRERLWRFSGTIESPSLSQEQLRELLRSRGYRDIREVRHEPTAYDVVAYVGTVPYRIRVSVATGEIESEYRLR